MSNSILKCLALLVLVLCISCQPKEEIHEVVIIGGGLMGSASAWQLAKNGNKVLLLEQQDSIYTSGSSQGQARIARSSNRGNDMWSFLHNSSVAEVKELISFLSRKDLSHSYAISDIYKTLPVSYIGRMTIYDKLMASLIRQNVDYKIATTPAQGKELFDVNLPDDVLLQREYNSQSGVINPERLIRYLHKAISLQEGEVNYKRKVLDIRKIEGVYEIDVKDVSSELVYKIRCKQVVSAAGPHTGQLLQDVAPYFERLINPQRVFLAFYKIRKSIYESMNEDDVQKLNDAYPVINSSKGTRDGSFFSMIEYFDEDEVPVIKIGGHFQRSKIEDMDNVWKRELEEEEKEWAYESTLGYFKLLGLDIKDEDLLYDHGYSCVYSLTETEVPLVTPIIGTGGKPDSSFIVMGGMSGVGAKGAMSYGKIASHYITGELTQDSLMTNVSEALGFQRLRSDIPQ